MAGKTGGSGFQSWKAQPSWPSASYSLLLGDNALGLVCLPLSAFWVFVPCAWRRKVKSSLFLAHFYELCQLQLLLIEACCALHMFSNPPLDLNIPCSKEKL